MAPPERCEEHDLIIDEYGCWACGHGGPLTDAVWPSWCAWVGALPGTATPEEYARAQRGQHRAPQQVSGQRQGTGSLILYRAGPDAFFYLQQAHAGRTGWRSE
jgi:hypothetical protein